MASRTMWSLGPPYQMQIQINYLVLSIDWMFFFDHNFFILIIWLKVESHACAHDVDIHFFALNFPTMLSRARELVTRRSQSREKPKRSRAKTSHYAQFNRIFIASSRRQSQFELFSSTQRHGAVNEWARNWNDIEFNLICRTRIDSKGTSHKFELLQFATSTWAFPSHRHHHVLRRQLHRHPQFIKDQIKIKYGRLSPL